nr:MAG TPA: hypothetical protein [Caudoviricetes sp.]
MHFYYLTLLNYRFFCSILPILYLYYNRFFYKCQVFFTAFFDNIYLIYVYHIIIIFYKSKNFCYSIINKIF